MSSLDKEMNFNKENFVITTLGNINDNYMIIKLLDTGSFGKFYEVKNKTTNNIYACKELTKRKIKSIEKFNTEIKIMKKCDHPNIIKLYEIYEDDSHIDLIMEECVGGKLFDRIEEHIEKKQMYSEKEAAHIFKQLMSAIAYCHSQGICHRDLKPENILFLNKDENSTIKIIHFGLSKIFRETIIQKK
jgi:calcium-dependent protein kinase